jgi:outer membrane protein OmpA-like peptidoglycan-associated protein
MKDFILRGDAIIGGDECIQLTEPTMWQGGGLWYRNLIDLRESFEMEIDIIFGCDDEGADGIVFIFHPELTTGYQGEGMGFGGLYFPSFGIEMDTYENYHLGDPWYDHVAFMQNGFVHHQKGVSEPYPLLEGKRNVEDCTKHRIKIQWSPKSKQVTFSFDGSIRLQQEIDLIDQIFDDPFVYWGFTSATGAKVNTHSVCLKTLRFSTVTAFSKNTRDLLLEGDRYTLKDIDFSPGSTILPKNADEELAKLTMFLKENPEHSIFLSGYTDSSGNAERNQQLSQKRAKSVADYLKKNGIPARRIHFKGYGENDPIAPNDTPEGQKENRRIEVMVKILRV